MIQQQGAMPAIEIMFSFDILRECRQTRCNGQSETEISPALIEETVSPTPKQVPASVSAFAQEQEKVITYDIHMDT